MAHRHLVLGLFYLSRRALTVIVIFILNIVLFLLIAAFDDTDSSVSIQQMGTLFWLSNASAAIYITWMALYYSRIVGLKSELEAEVEQSRKTFVELEEARKRTDALVKIRARFFSKISHELRTPLNSIIGYSEMLLEDLEGCVNEGDIRIKDVSRIMAAGKHLLSLVSRVLDSKTIEEDEGFLGIDAFTLGDLCEEVVATALPLVKKNGNRFVVNCTRREYVLSSDATRLRQIMINLLSNAAKFTTEGTIKLDLDIVEQSGADVLRVAVVDTGIGISEDGLARIFRDYEQAEADTVARYGGTGIGPQDGDDGRALERAKQVVEALSEPFENEGQPRWQISASVGVASAAICSFRTETLMKAADLAMYNAKAAGRGRTVVFEQRLLDEQTERSLLEVDLRRALELDQFAVYYQPLIDAKTKKINAFEALVRWHHPEKFAGPVHSGGRGGGPDQPDRCVGAQACLR